MFIQAKDRDDHLLSAQRADEADDQDPSVVGCKIPKGDPHKPRNIHGNSSLPAGLDTDDLYDTRMFWKVWSITATDNCKSGQHLCNPY